MTIVHVAVAVIYHADQFLLGYRKAHQHQGNRYEFVGGKIEANETALQGLIREVQEEIGCEIAHNLAIKLGVIRHEYVEKDKPKKSVALHVFKIELNKTQFDSLQTQQGAEGQAITWVNKADLLAKRYPLPDANMRILGWLTLPDTIFISQNLANFDNSKDYLDFYSQTLSQNTVFYHRPQTDSQTNVSLIQHLLKQRQDLTPIIQWQALQESGNKFDFSKSIIHLNHKQLMTLNFDILPNDLRYFASCHDKNSLSKVNELAKTHTLMGCFLSPVHSTPTHPAQNGMGWQAFGELASKSDVPVFALGGVNQSDLPTAWQHGAAGVAGIRLIDKTGIILNNAT